MLYLLGFEPSDGLSSPGSPTSATSTSGSGPARQSSLRASQTRRLPTEKVIDTLDSLAHHGVVHGLSSITECSLLAMAYITAVDFPPRMQPHYSARAVQLLMHRAEYDAHKFSGVAWVILLEVISRVEALIGGQTEFTRASEGSRDIPGKSTLVLPLSVAEAGCCHQKVGWHVLLLLLLKHHFILLLSFSCFNNYIYVYTLHTCLVDIHSCCCWLVSFIRRMRTLVTSLR